MRTIKYRWTGFIVMAVWALGSMSCTNEEIITEATKSKGEPWTITATQGADAGTRLGYTEEFDGSVTVKWAKDDAFTVFGSTSGKADFTLKEEDAGQSSGTFTSTDTNPSGDYKAFFPKTTAASYNECVMDLTGQTQTINDDMDHLSDYDYMTGAVTFNGDEPTVNFTHEMLMMKFVLTFPAALASGESLQRLSIGAEKADKTTPAFYIKKGIEDADLDVKANTQELILNGVPLDSDHKLTAYMMMYTFNLAENDKLTFMVQTNQRVYSHTATITIPGGKQYAPGKRYTATATLATSPIQMNTVFIPAGTFIMGDNEVPSSSPAHSVTLTRGFYMGECEVTNTQYADFLNAGTVSGTISLTQGDETDGIYASANVLGSSQKLVFDCMTGTRSPWGVTYNTVTSQWEATSGKGNYPVGYVTWYGAKAFASWAKGKVPTSAQWEYACRAGTTTPWATATGTSTDLGTYAWWISNSGLSTHPVKTKNPNLWNLYDMIGNAEEWCDDKSRNYTPAAVTDPVGNGTPIILRQSGCYANDDACRSAFYMTVLDPNDVFPQSGFRIAFVP